MNWKRSCVPGGPAVVRWNVARGPLGVVDQWTQLLRDNLELDRVQMRDNGAEAGGLCRCWFAACSLVLLTSCGSKYQQFPYHTTWWLALSLSSF